MNARAIALGTSGIGPLGIGPVCVLGTGLIGGSLMRDLAARGVSVFGYTRSAADARQTVADGFDVATSLAAALQRAESEAALIVIAVPFNAVAEVVDAIAQFAPSCGVTDVVSVKTPVHDIIAARGMLERYVGGHPMAGTESSGWAASHTGLFARAAWVVTYDFAADCAARGQQVPQAWAALFSQVCTMTGLVGAEAVPVSAGKHDEAVARVSHLPHVVAEALAVVGDRGRTLAQSLAAGSFKGATRVAGTEPALVRNMCETNAAPLATALAELISLLEDAHSHLTAQPPSIQHLAESGHRAYERMTARTAAERESVSPVAVSSRPVMRVHPGGPGWVQQLKQIEAIGGRIEVF